jgi:uncharacterized phage protein (TIGR02220 family)
MFNKSITNSSKFLKMPMSSRLLYYDLGMNADDDGFVEHFMVLRMTGASEQDLGVLELNGLIKVFDENVLWIKDWKENNYIQKDRYTPSKYLQVYNLDTICIQNVDTGKDRLELGKDSIELDNIYSPAKQDNIPYQEIINYLNLKAKTNYKYTTKKTKDCIKARINEGFTLEDFKLVIDNKANEWLGTNMEQYLRPETLFGNKFEGYLNQKTTKVLSNSEKQNRILEAIVNGEIKVNR